MTTTRRKANLRDQHIERHKELHRAFDELLADWICHTGKLPSEHSITVLMEWAYEQTINPTEVDARKNW